MAELSLHDAFISLSDAIVHHLERPDADFVLARQATEHFILMSKRLRKIE